MVKLLNRAANGSVPQSTSNARYVEGVIAGTYYKAATAPKLQVATMSTRGSLYGGDKIAASFPPGIDRPVNFGMSGMAGALPEGEAFQPDILRSNTLTRTRVFAPDVGGTPVPGYVPGFSGFFPDTPRKVMEMRQLALYK